MKLVEQYLYAIGRQLPKDGKEEILEELRSTLLDTIEDQYGFEASEEEISQTLKSFGSPSEVAKSYGKSRYVIEPALTDIYWLIVKIVFFAMLGSFTIIFVIQLVSGELEGRSLFFGFLNIFRSSIFTSISAIGSITLVFSIISKYVSKKNPSENWDPKYLEELPRDKEVVNVIGTAAAIVFSVIFMIFFNLYPEVINIPSYQLLRAGIGLVHFINMEVFFSYLSILNVLWLATIIQSIFILIKTAKTKPLRLMGILINFASIALFLQMVNDQTLYMGDMNLRGFRSIFIFLLVVMIIDTLSELIKFFVHE